ncbi:hypothetical protein E3N88_19795 [Mikania micrantha]|uniref:Uncharacterized protein n=1 Tax=Mikania micrantha TaxID=192012 RepID=A0A5N6NQK4_9ASTR|nr:hypothetical protein E3N88_19795 [Mikania micrantha]
MEATTTNHRVTEAEEQYNGDNRGSGPVAVHNQVKKIKQEMENTKHPANIEQSEIKSVLREFSKSQKRCRSPLGITDLPITVLGDFDR